MATNEQIEKTFAQVYGWNSNFITPEIHAYGYSLEDESIFFEISQGNGIFPNTHLVGVTVIDSDGNKLEHLNKVFSDDRSKRYNMLSLAREYGESLA